MFQGSLKGSSTSFLGKRCRRVGWGSPWVMPLLLPQFSQGQTRDVLSGITPGKREKELGQSWFSRNQGSCPAAGQVPLEREECDKVTQGASRQSDTWAPSQPPNGVAAPAPSPPGLHPRTPEHPSVIERDPFREPSAPPSVPKYSRGSVLHIRDVSGPRAVAGPRGWGGVPHPSIHKEPFRAPVPPLFSRLTVQIPSASSRL